MIWADRIAAALVVALGVFWLALLSVGAVAHAGATLEDAIGNFISTVVFAILPFWVVLRIVDIMSGARRRRTELVELERRLKTLEERTTLQ